MAANSNEVADYIGQMAGELADAAENAALPVLAFVLRMAEQEAKGISKPSPGGPMHHREPL